MNPANVGRIVGLAWKTIIRLVIFALLGVAVLGVLAFAGAETPVALLTLLAVIAALTVSIIVVWRGFTLIPPTVARCTLPDRTEDETEIVRRVRREWVGWCRDAGLTVARPTEKNPQAVATARVAGWGRDPRGIYMMVDPLPGLGTDALVGKLSTLTGHFFRPIEVTGTEVGQARLLVIQRDALAGVRQAAAVSGFRIPVGRCEDGTEGTVDISDASHIGVQGMTRSGKSALTYALLGQWQSDPRVLIGGIDPNRVLLAPIAHRNGTAWIAQGQDSEDHLRVLDGFISLMNERLDMLGRTFTEKVEPEQFTAELPVALLVLEEYDGILKSADDYDAGLKPAERIKPRIVRAVGALVAQGAKAGVRVLIITQRMDASIVDGPIRAQLGTRITMKVDNRDAVVMLHPQASPELVAKVPQFSPGRCIFWQYGNERIMQSDLLPYSEYLGRFGITPRATEV